MANHPPQSTIPLAPGPSGASPGPVDWFIGIQDQIKSHKEMMTGLNTTVDGLKIAVAAATLGIQPIKIDTQLLKVDFSFLKRDEKGFTIAGHKNREAWRKARIENAAARAREKQTKAELKELAGLTKKELKERTERDRKAAQERERKKILLAAKKDREDAKMRRAEGERWYYKRSEGVRLAMRLDRLGSSGRDTMPAAAGNVSTKKRGSVTQQQLKDVIGELNRMDAAVRKLSGALGRA